MLKEIKFILLFSAILFLIIAAPTYFFIKAPFKYLQDRYIIDGVLSLLITVSFVLAFGDEEKNRSRAALYLFIILVNVYLLFLPFSFTNFYAILVFIILAILTGLLIFLGVVIFQIADLFNKDVVFLEKLDKWAFVKLNKFYNFIIRIGDLNAEKLQGKDN
jgi:hypothetical protein